MYDVMNMSGSSSDELSGVHCCYDDNEWCAQCSDMICGVLCIVLACVTLRYVVLESTEANRYFMLYDW